MNIVHDLNRDKHNVLNEKKKITGGKMNEKDLYKQKLKAQMYDWQTKLAGLKAKVGGASMGAKLELNQLVMELENKVAEGRAKLADLDSTTDESWDMIKDGVETIWDGITTAFDNVSSKFES